MARYSPELIAAVRHDYEQSGKSLAQIAADNGISERSISRMRDREGWARRSERVRGIPASAHALHEVTKLLAARDALACGRQMPPTPDPSPPFAARMGGGEMQFAAPAPLPFAAPTAGGEMEFAAPAPPPLAARTEGEEKEDAAPAPPPFAARTDGEEKEDAAPAQAPSPLAIPIVGGETAESAASPYTSAIERIERLVERDLEAEEAARRSSGPKTRTAADASARTLSTLTQTLHALSRLRSGLPPDSGPDHDDMPRDIDEFRRGLARRIRQFVQSRAGGGLDGVGADDGAAAREP